MRDISAFNDLTQDILNFASLGIRPGLERTSRLLSVLGSPHEEIKMIHVLGTNGKGSTAATIASILRCCGAKTALSTSPHLVSLQERLRIGDGYLSIDTWRGAFERVCGAVLSDGVLNSERPTFFEHLTAMIFLMTAEADVDIAVFEAGMGGRYDASTVCKSIATVITPIAIDHAQYLGSTIEAIASEKFAAMHRGVPAFYRASTPQLDDLFLKMSADIGSIPHIPDGDTLPSNVVCSLDGTTFDCMGMNALRTPLVGAHQAQNASLAISVALALSEQGALGPYRVEEGRVRDGLASTVWPGRFEVVRGADGAPRMILDGAHNAHGMRALVKAVRDADMRGYYPSAAVFGAMGDKDVGAILDELAYLRLPVIAAEPRISRAMPCGKLADEARAHGVDVRGAHRSVKDAIAAAESMDRDGIVICCGSLYLVGEVKEVLLDE